MPKTQSDTVEKKFTVRIPKALHEQLVEVAMKEKRSLNAQLIFMLEVALKNQQKCGS